MAISLNTGLPEVSLVGMPSALDLATDARLVSTGSPASIEIQFGASRGSGDSFELSYNGLTLPFTFDGDDGSGYNFDGFSTSGQFDDFVQAFISNFYISRDFEATITMNAPTDKRLLLTARLNGSAYDVTMNPLYSGSVETPGVDDAWAENFEVLAQIFANHTGDWELITLVKGAVNESDESFKIWVHNVLKELCSFDLPSAAYTGPGTDNYAGRVNGAVIKWHARVFEQWGDPPLIRNPYNFGTEASPKFAIDYALAKQDFVSHTAAFNAITAASNRKFLNTRKRMKVHKSQLVYLNVLVPKFTSGSGNTNTDIVVKRYNASEITITTTKAMSPSEWEQWAFVVSVPFVLAAYSTAYAMVVDVEGFWNGNWKTEQVTLIIDKADYENLNHFIYRNRAGGWESVYFTGHLKKLKGYEAQEAELEAESYDTEAEGYTYNHLRNSQFVLNTGFKSPEEREDLTNMADSSEVYWLQGEYGTAEAQWLKVLIDPRGFEKVSDSLEDDAQAFEFGFRLAKRDF